MPEFDLLDIPESVVAMASLLRHPAALPATGPGHAAELAREMDPAKLGELDYRKNELDEIFPYGLPVHWFNSPAARCSHAAMYVAPLAAHRIAWELTFPGADCADGNRLHVEFNRLGYAPLGQWLDSNAGQFTRSHAQVAADLIRKRLGQMHSPIRSAHLGAFSHYPIVPAVVLELCGPSSPYRERLLSSSLGTTEGYTLGFDQGGTVVFFHYHANQPT